METVSVFEQILLNLPNFVGLFYALHILSRILLHQSTTINQMVKDCDCKDSNTNLDRRNNNL